MPENFKRLAIIPARGGSKRIPRKNLVKICGRSIIDYILDSAIESKLFDKIIVSSDSKEILDHVKNFPTIFPKLRPEVLSNDHATIYSVIKYEVERELIESAEYDEIWLLSATACLISANDLTKIASDSRKSVREGFPVLGVTEYEVPVQWAMNINESGNLNSIDFESFNKRSQDLNNSYHDAGCLAIFPPQIFSKFEDGVPEGNFRPCILNRNKAFDVDSPADLEIVEAMLAKKLKLT
jgi:CMP-N-acetylneuraminic acid synthetase